MLPGDKEQRTDAVKQQTEYHTPAVSEATDEKSCRNGHNEVSHIHRHLYKGRMCLRDIQYLLKKLTVSIEFWRTKGGCLADETIQKLRDAGVSIEVINTTNYKTNKKPVRMDYLDDIDIAEFREIPTYKRMCICILKNDHACKYMGFALNKEEAYKRDKIMEQFKNMML